MRETLELRHDIDMSIIHVSPGFTTSAKWFQIFHHSASYIGNYMALQTVIIIAPGRTEVLMSRTYIGLQCLPGHAPGAERKTKAFLNNPVAVAD